MVRNNRITVLLKLLVVLLVILGACTNNDEKKSEEQGEESKAHENSQAIKDREKYAIAPTEFNQYSEDNLLTLNTKNITRISTNDPIEASIYVSQTIWPSTHKENQPGTVILAPLGNWQNSLASTNLIHHPNNGPLLFISSDRIPSNIIDEIKRLKPLGNSKGTHIMIMGDVSRGVIEQLSDYKIEQINAESPAAFAQRIDETYADVAGGYPNGVIIVSSEEQNKLHSIPAVNWIAHMPEPVLFVYGNEIPKETKDALKQRDDSVNIYVLGPESVISKEIEEQLREYGNVQRIGKDAEDAISTSIELAKFKDEETDFGWGLAQPGHGVSFVSTENHETAIAAAPFSHLGKHAPLVWVNKGQLQKETYNFLSILKPTFKDSPTEGPYNHGFIIGDTNSIPYQTQGILDEKLEIVQEQGKEHEGH